MKFALRIIFRLPLKGLLGILNRYLPILFFVLILPFNSCSHKGNNLLMQELSSPMRVTKIHVSDNLGNDSVINSIHDAYLTVLDSFSKINQTIIIDTVDTANSLNAFIMHIGGEPNYDKRIHSSTEYFVKYINKVASDRNNPVDTLKDVHFYPDKPRIYKEDAMRFAMNVGLIHNLVNTSNLDMAGAEDTAKLTLSVDILEMSSDFQNEEQHYLKYLINNAFVSDQKKRDLEHRISFRFEPNFLTDKSLPADITMNFDFYKKGDTIAVNLSYIGKKNSINILIPQKLSHKLWFYQGLKNGNQFNTNIQMNMAIKKFISNQLFILEGI